MELRIEPLRPDDWERLRAIRIEMLEAEPTAFLELAAEARELDDSDWRRRAAELSTDEAGGFFATDEAGADAGFVAVSRGEGAALIHAMYVREPARGVGAAERLIDAAAGWAGAHALAECVLWVREDNARARTVYERCGFRPTGESRPYRFDESFREHQLRRHSVA